MGAVSFSLDPRLVQELRHALPLDTFVETGTFRGDTVSVVEPQFNRIYTIELSEELYSESERRFSGNQKVSVIHGDSRQILRQLSPQLTTRSAFYWLDAHWCVAEGTAGETSQCPLLEELDAIGNLNGDSIIVIDDARLFLCPPGPPHEISQWPRFHEVVERLLALGAHHKISVVNDMIVFFPKQAQLSLEGYSRKFGVDWLQAYTLLDESRTLLLQLEEKEQVIQTQSEMLTEVHVAQKEKEEIIQAQSKALMEAQRGLQEKEEAIQAQSKALMEAQRGLQEKEEAIQAQSKALMEAQRGLQEKEEAVQAQSKALMEAQRGLQEKEEAVQAQSKALMEAQRGLQEKEEAVQAQSKALMEAQRGLQEKEEAVQAQSKALMEAQRGLQEKEEAVQAQSKALAQAQARLLEDKERFIQQQSKALEGLGASLDKTLGGLQAILQEGTGARIKEKVLVEALEAKERVIQEQARALSAYRAAWERLNPLRPVMNISRHLRSLVRPRLGSLYQYPPQPLHLPEAYRKPVTLKQPPKISIVTPTFQQAGFIERTLKSVLDQSYPNLEYFVQDGGSQDGTVEILRRYEKDLSGWDSRPDNGQSHAINLGFAKTSGEIMAWLNSDDLLLPGSLANVAKFFTEHPEVDVVYGHRILINEDDQEIGRWMMPRHDEKVLSWVDYIPQETLFWRRGIWEKAGGEVDESFRFAMDWDLLVRFREAGASFARLPRFIGAFRVHPQQKTSAAISEVGHQEMARIRARALGREVSYVEIHKATLPYLMRHVATDLGYRIRNKLGYPL